MTPPAREPETPETFDTYRKAHPDARFTTWLKQRTEPTWTEATEHRFVEEMADGSIDDAVYRAYLVQDRIFVEALIDLFGYAVARAPTIDAKRPFIEFLDLVTSDENDYFQRAFDALDVPASTRRSPEAGETTNRFVELLERASDGSYADALAVLVPAEWIYLDWGTRLSADPPRDWVLREWIDLHANPGFTAFVENMRSELDRIGERAGPDDRARIAGLFEDVVELEVAFWDQAYEMAADA